MPISNRRLGSDLMLQDGDFILRNNGDAFSTIDYEKANIAASRFPGYHHIYFSLADRLLTPRGSNEFHPEYGSDLPKMCSSPMDQEFEDRVRNEIKTTILQDDRIKRVDRIDVEFRRNNTMFITVSVVIAGTEQKAQFVFPNFIVGD